jgi:hypothetical protein
MVVESTCPAWPRPRRRAGRAASRPPGAETLPVPRRAPFRVFGRGTAVPVPFVACIGSEQCRSAPPCRAAAGPQAAGAENRDEPWGPLGDAKWIFKPGAAFVTSSTISTHALKPKYEHRKNAPNLWARARPRSLVNLGRPPRATRTMHNVCRRRAWRANERKTSYMTRRRPKALVEVRSYPCQLRPFSCQVQSQPLQRDLAPALHRTDAQV